jgi:predicted nuclease of predicted toxin-antitoxin system
VPAVKLDENVPDSVGTTLREAGHDVALAREEQLVGAPDDLPLTVAAGEGRILITFDRGFANVIQHPPEATPGVVVIRLRDQTLPRIRRIAATVGSLLKTKPIRGRLWSSTNRVCALMNLLLSEE